MTLEIAFNIEDQSWLDTVPWYREVALRVTEQTLNAAGHPVEGIEISVLLASDARIALLNENFRGKAVPTNVLSWPCHDLAPPAPGARPPSPPDGELGDIAMARETIEKEAAEQHLTVEARFAHLFAHGLLHLLGYDHETDADAAVMEGLEIQALAAMGIADPYV